MKSKVDAIIQHAVEQVNNTLSKPHVLDFKKDVILFGENGIFDSIALVTLILNVEEELSNQLEIHFSLASEKAMSRRNSPFHSIETLSQYVMEMIQEGSAQC